VFDVDPGPDGVPGSADDVRGDDVNLHWFNPNNDPFQLPIHMPVDTTQYQRDTAFLPGGDNFAANASRELAADLGLPPAEAVMQQLTYYNETQRELISDGVTSVMLAESGLDETAGTSDDYQLVLTYEGITSGSQCDITVAMEAISNFAYCSTGGYFVGSGHARISSASVHLGSGYAWHFNTELRGSGNQPPTAGNDGASLDEDSAADLAVLGNDSDPDGDTLSITSVSNPPNGSATLNPDNTIRYEPDSNYNGADYFSYTVSDGNGGSDSASVSMTVNPVNDFPVAVDDSGITTPADTPVEIFVLDNDSDVDGDPLNVSAVTDGAIGAVTNNNGYVSYQPNPGASGADSFGYTVSDGNGGSDTATVSLTVLATPDPVTPDYAVADFNTVQGTVSGSYVATQADGGAVQSVTETHTGGKPSGRADSLEHIWQFELASGNTHFNVDAQASFPGGDKDSAFEFQWSTSPSGGWQTMVTVPGGAGSFDIGDGVSGTVYVRVIDNNSDPGNTVYSTISVDHMFFDGAMPPTERPQPASDPNPPDGATSVPVNAILSWSAGAGTDTHDLYFGTVAGALTLVSDDQDGNSYDPGALSISTTYYWRVDEQNAIGTTAGTEWSFTTTSSAGPTELLIDSIVLGSSNADRGQKNGQAVVTVVDDFGNAIDGATITGTFIGSFNETVSGDTAGGGVATLTTSSNPQKKNIAYTFCVDAIAGVPGLAYIPATPDCQTY